ncbi:MAG TPA: hypothetical protein VJP59_03680 [Gemmatimonadota bacterium]|nr:hypothetical protein [Gemmatimonadota bacterium]
MPFPKVDTATTLLLPRQARPGIFAPPNVLADAPRVRSTAAAVR